MIDILTVNELFSGIGAFRKALIRLNIPHEIVGISEIDKFAIKSYNAMYGDTRNYGDISQISKLDYADLWTYGFPCQDISYLGLKQGLIKNKTRSGLLYEVQGLLKIASDNNELPKYLIMENVKALTNKKFKSKFEEWLNWLNECGYNNYWSIMKACDYGIPQSRERVIVVSIRKDVDSGYVFPEPEPLKIKFKDLLEKQVDEKYYLKNSTYEYYIKHNHYCKIKGFNFYAKYIDREQANIANTLTTIPIRPEANLIYDYTTVTHCDRSQVRRLTSLEYWRLMGFDDTDYYKAKSVNSDTQLYKQAGNSIVVNVLTAVLHNLLRGDYQK